MNRIRTILNQRGIEELRPTKEMLDKLGIKYPTWNLWMSNDKDPNMSHAPLIAKILNVEVTELFDMGIETDQEGVSFHKDCFEPVKEK